MTSVGEKTVSPVKPHPSPEVLTHLQVLIEQAQLAEVQQGVVLLPAAVMVFRIVSSLSATPHVTNQPIKKPMMKHRMNKLQTLGFAQSQQDISRER